MQMQDKWLVILQRVFHEFIKFIKIKGIMHKFKFIEKDIDSCWPDHYKEYLLQILNGDYSINEARKDLLNLIGTRYDKRTRTNSTLYY